MKRKVIEDIMKNLEGLDLYTLLAIDNAIKRIIKEKDK